MSRKKLLKSQFAMSNMAFFLNFYHGVWHGLEVYYIVYGLYHAALVMAIMNVGVKASTTLAKWIYNRTKYHYYIPFVTFGFLISQVNLFNKGVINYGI